MRIKQISWSGINGTRKNNKMYFVLLIVKRITVSGHNTVLQTFNNWL